MEKKKSLISLAVAGLIAAGGVVKATPAFAAPGDEGDAASEGATKKEGKAAKGKAGKNKKGHTCDHGCKKEGEEAAH